MPERKREKTRERWLLRLVDALGPMFAEHGANVPSVLISVGFPSKRATSSRNRRIGECWYGACSADGRPHVFISPVLADPAEVAGVVVHELIHAVCGAGVGHKGPFRKLALALGLEGKMTATAVGAELAKRLNALIRKLGPYPHPKLTATGGKPKQGTRMLKLECPACGYVVRTTAKWVAVGLPTCVCGEGFESV